MYDADLDVNDNSPVAVKVGCDLEGLKVRKSTESGLFLDLKLTADDWDFMVKGESLVVSK